MRQPTVKRFLNALSCVGLLLAVAVVFAPVQAQEAAKRPGVPQARNPHTSVSNDGSTFDAPELSGQTFVPPVEGLASEGMASDALAEFRETAESASTVWKLWNLQAPGRLGNPEVIIGADNRTRVNPTTVDPARRVALITFSAGRCTGWFIGKNTIVTAGHCVYDTANNRWYPVSSYRIYAGRNGNSSPYGSCTARRLHSVTGYTSSENIDYDYAAIRLNCNVGLQTGTFGWLWQSASLTGTQTIINGYPGDKPLTQWRSIDRVRNSLTRRLEYQNDTKGGQSGAAVHVNRAGCNPCAIAVHAYGDLSVPPTKNWGPRITEEVFNRLKAWRDAP